MPRGGWIMRHDTVAVVRGLSARLRRLAPVRGPVTVRLRVNLRGEQRACGIASRVYCPTRKVWEFAIELDACLTPDEARDTLVHEWAHVLSWTETADHGKRWGLAFARCYRASLRDR